MKVKKRAGITYEQSIQQPYQQQYQPRYSPEYWRMVVRQVERSLVDVSKPDDFGGLGKMVGFIFFAAIFSKLIARIMEVISR